MSAATAVPQSTSREARSWRLLLGGVLLLALVLRLWLWGAAQATEEDFYITLRYAANLARGQGFVYNLGEHVLGTTTPLYTLLLSLCIRLHLNPLLCGPFLGLLADGLACLFVFRLGKAVGHPGAGIAAALCLATAPINLTWATKGMETGIVAAAGVAAWAFWAERRELPAWIAAALLLLLRIDGAALALLLLGATWLRDRRLPWRGLGLFLLLVLPWLLFAWSYFGSPIPVSLQAKLTVYGWQTSSRFPNLLPFLTLMTRNPFGLVMALGVGYSGVQVFRCSGVQVFGYLASTKNTKQHEEDHETNRETRETHEKPKPPPSLVRNERQGKGAGGLGKPEYLLPPFLWMGLHYGSMAFSKVFLFGWYFVPPTPIYYLLAMVGWGWLFREVRLRAGRGEWMVQAGQRVALVVLAGIGLSIGSVPRVLATLRESQRVETEMRIPIGRWLRAHAAPTDRVMLEPIGYIGYYSGLRVLDTVGLVSPEVLPFYRREVESPYHLLWRQFQPEWILLRAGEERDLARYEARLAPAERLENFYRRVQTWKNSDGSVAFQLYQRDKRP